MWTKGFRRRSLLKSKKKNLFSESALYIPSSWVPIWPHLVLWDVDTHTHIWIWLTKFVFGAKLGCDFKHVNSIGGAPLTRHVQNRHTPIVCADYRHASSLGKLTFVRGMYAPPGCEAFWAMPGGAVQKLSQTNTVARNPIGSSSSTPDLSLSLWSSPTISGTFIYYTRISISTHKPNHKLLCIVVVFAPHRWMP